MSFKAALWKPLGDVTDPLSSLDLWLRSDRDVDRIEITSSYLLFLLSLNLQLFSKVKFDVFKFLLLPQICHFLSTKSNKNSKSLLIKTVLLIYCNLTNQLINFFKLKRNLRLAVKDLWSDFLWLPPATDCILIAGVVTAFVKHRYTECGKNNSSNIKQLLWLYVFFSPYWPAHRQI